MVSAPAPRGEGSKGQFQHAASEEAAPMPFLLKCQSTAAGRHMVKCRVPGVVPSSMPLIRPQYKRRRFQLEARAKPRRRCDGYRCQSGGRAPRAAGPPIRQTGAEVPLDLRQAGTVRQVSRRTAAAQPASSKQREMRSAAGWGG